MPNRLYDHRYMTRRDQVQAVASVAGITTAQARLALDAVGGLVKVGLLEDQKMVLAGVGTFLVVDRRARNIRNPATGVMMELPATSVIKFRPVPDLRASVEEAHAR
jgi:DNA-binding protein HU-beta